jgi:hypothetical protein
VVNSAASLLGAEVYYPTIDQSPNILRNPDLVGKVMLIRGHVWSKGRLCQTVLLGPAVIAANLFARSFLPQINDAPATVLCAMMALDLR